MKPSSVQFDLFAESIQISLSWKKIEF